MSQEGTRPRTDFCRGTLEKITKALGWPLEKLKSMRGFIGLQLCFSSNTSTRSNHHFQKLLAGSFGPGCTVDCSAVTKTLSHYFECIQDTFMIAPGQGQILSVVVLSIATTCSRVRGQTFESRASDDRRDDVSSIFGVCSALLCSP